MQLNKIGDNVGELDFNDQLTVLISYSTPVAMKWKGEYYVTDKFFSRATRKHISRWVGTNEYKQLSQSVFNKAMIRCEPNIDVCQLTLNEVI